MEIPYTHMNHVLVSSFSPKYGDVINKKPLVKFIEYLKSQVHYNIITIIHDRNILEYNNAYNYVKGRISNPEDYKKVIRYYYSDVADIILKSNVELKEDFSIIGSNEIPRADGLEKITIDVDSVAADIDSMINGTGAIVNKHNLDYYKLVGQLPAHLMSFKCKRVITEALLLKYFGDSKDVIYREVG